MTATGGLVLASFNSHWGITRKGRPYDLLRVCMELDADALVLQEVWQQDGAPGTAAEVAEALGYTLHWFQLAPSRLDPRPHLVARSERATGMWGLAMLARLPVLRTERIDLGHLPMDLAPRVAVRMDIGAGDSVLSVFGTHLSHLSHGSLLQLRRLRAHLPGADTPAALLGDLNMWGPVASRFFPGWRRAVKGRTWPGRFAHSQIDHIFVTRPVEIVSAEVLGYQGSDHRPVRAEVRL